MNCFQITLKSGQQVNIYTKGDLLKLSPEGLDAGKLETCHYFVDIDEVASILELTQNAKNQTEWAHEHKDVLAESDILKGEREVNAERMWEKQHPTVVTP